MDKQLEKEGISEKLYNSIDMQKSFSPVQLKPNEEPVSLIKCSTGFWVMLPGEKYLRDDKNKLVVLPEEIARESRARYLTKYKDHVLQVSIQDEVDRLRIQVDKKLAETLKQMKNILRYADKLPGDGHVDIITLVEKQHDNENYLKKVKIAKAACSDGKLLKLYTNLLKQQKENNYDALYMYFFQAGLPQIGSFDTSSQAELSVLVKLFSAPTVETTIEELKSKDHLYNVARINVEKRNA